MARENWGRWGAEDERGALNSIGPAEVRAAAGLIRTGEVLSLAQPLSQKTPVPSYQAPLMHLMNRDGGDYAAGATRHHGFQVAEDTLIAPVHVGTHIDALCHAWYDDELFNGFPGSGTRSTSGATRCGAEKLGPIVSRGLLFDMVKHRGRPLDKGEAITAADLQAVADIVGMAPRPGDVVLVRTGWRELHGAKARDYYQGEPGIDVGAALWLAEAGVAVVGADNYAVEPLPFPPDSFFPVHQRLIRDYGVPLLEGLVLEQLAAAGATAFFFSAAPLPLVGATGSPLTPVAIL